MTQKEANILVEIITKVVRKELGLFKKQLLSEGYKPVSTTTRSVSARVDNRGDSLVDIQKNFRSQYHVQRPQAKRLSNDPILNSLLSETVAIDEAEKEFEEQMMANGINLPTTETGQIMSSNKNVNHVLEAMNRDYSGMFTPKQEKQSQSPKPDPSQLRSKFRAMMEEDYNVGGYTTNGSDEEDFSFLDRVS